MKKISDLIKSKLALFKLLEKNFPSCDVTNVREICSPTRFFNLEHFSSFSPSSFGRVDRNHLKDFYLDHKKVNVKLENGNSSSGRVFNFQFKGQI